MIWWLAATMALQTRTCVSINNDQILAADLARAIPEFSAVPAETKLGYAPAPGAKRVFRIDELHRIAVRYRIPLTVDRPACFVWQLERLSPNDVITAMKRSLDAPDARIDGLSLSSSLAPKGKLVFPRLGMTVSASYIMWRGYVQYARTRRFEICARAKITMPITRVVATAEIPAGKEIQAADLKIETIEGFSASNDLATRIEDVVNRAPLIRISAGSPVMRRNLVAPIEVNAGDTAQVKVKSGAAVLSFEARAERSGRDGEVIPLRNPSSGKVFRARVEGRGKVIVLTPPLEAQVN